MIRRIAHVTDGSGYRFNDRYYVVQGENEIDCVRKVAIDEMAKEENFKIEECRDAETGPTKVFFVNDDWIVVILVDVSELKQLR